MKLLSTVKEAWLKREKSREHLHDRELAQFLPAALEIQATPPHPLARVLTWTLVSLVAIGILWACLSQVNIVASADGKIIPSSRVKQIQPLEKAVVKAILVKEGQYVEEGDALIELDNTRTFADQARLSAELDTAQNNLDIGKALLALLTLSLDQQQNLSYQQVNIKGNTEDSFHKQLLWQQWQEYWSQYQILQQSLKKTDAEKAATGEQIVKLQKTLPIINTRASKLKSLHEKNYASEDEYLVVEQERVEQAQDLKSEKQRFIQLQAAGQEIQQQINNLKAQTQAQQLTQITDYQSQVTALQKELVKAKDLNAKQVLYAPVSGRIQELTANTVGGVVTEAQQLMLIVPDEEQLEVEVFLENKDIGFVREGMLAEIKIHTFPFTKYGLINGEIITVSDDATLDENRGLIYGMRILMKNNAINVDGKLVKLIPGMEVTAEMQTGHRKIIEFFLAPLLKHQHEGLRER